MNITAIPINDRHIAEHFGQAVLLQLHDEYGHCIGVFDNPSTRYQCGSKRALINLLVDHDVKQVVVRQLGDKLREQLLAHDMIIIETRQGDFYEPDSDSLVSPTHRPPFFPC